MGKQRKQWETIFLGSKVTAYGDYSHEIKRCLLLGRKPRQHIQKQRHYLVNKGPSQSYGFSSSHVWMWELDYKESWALKNWWIWTVVLEKTLESPLDCKKIKPVNPKGNQSQTFIGMTDVEAETPIVWLPDVKNWLIGKDPDAGKDWRQEKGTTEGEMSLNLNKLWELVMTGKPGITAVYGVAKSWTWLSNWTELIHKQLPIEQARYINLWKII